MGGVDVHSHFRVQPTGSVVVGVVTTTITTITTITTTTTTIFLGCDSIELNLVLFSYWSKTTIPAGHVGLMFAWSGLGPSGGQVGWLDKLEIKQTQCSRP